MMVWNPRISTAYLGVAQLGSVLEWGSRGREFKSLHPDQLKSPENIEFSGLLLCLFLYIYPNFYPNQPFYPKDLPNKSLIAAC